MDEINLNSTYQPDDTINLEPAPVLPDPLTAKIRAAKASYGGAGDAKQIEQDILAGKEKDLREAFANQIDISKTNNASSLINSPLFDPSVFKPTDPSSVFEEKFAEKTMDKFHTGDDWLGGTYGKLAQVDPEGAAKSSVAGRMVLAWSEYLKRFKQDKEKEAEDQGYFSRGLDVAKDFIPGFRSVRLSTVPGGTFVESPLPGDKLENLRQQIVQEYDFDKRKALTESITNSLNPGMAVEFLNYLDHPTSHQQLLDNAFGAMDLFNVGQAGKIGLDAARLLKVRREFARMKSEVVKEVAANSENVPPAELVSNAVGHPEDAAKFKMDSKLQEQLRPAEAPQAEPLEGLQSVLRSDVNEITKGGTAGNFGAEAFNRMNAVLLDNVNKIKNSLINTSRVMRLGDTLAAKVVRDGIYAEIEGRYPGLSGNVLNILGIRWDGIVNRHVADVILGKNDGSFFESAYAAQKFADENGIVINNIHGVRIKASRPERQLASGGIPYGKTGAAINNVEGLDKGVFSQGTGYYVAVSRPIDETTDILRQAVIQTDKSLSKNSGWLNQMGLGGLRTAGEVLSRQENINRTLSMYAPALIKDVVHDAVGIPVNRALKASPRMNSVWNIFKKDSRFERMIKYGQDNQKEFKTVNELQQFYQQTFGEFANEAEVAGYFAYRQGLAMDYVFRNLALVRNMSRVGGEQHVLTRTVNGTLERSPSFVARSLKEVPNDTYNVLIQTGNDFKITRSQNLSKADREAVEKGQKRIIEIYDPGLNQLKDWKPNGDTRRVNYVLSDRTESRPLDFFQLPRKEGGHLEYKYDWYVKQAKITDDLGLPGEQIRKIYDGDKTAAAAESHALGKGNAEALNKVREAYRVGDILGAELASRSVKGITWTEIKNSFDKKEWDLNEPFHVVPKGKTIMDVPNNYPTNSDYFKDTSRGGSLAKQFQVEFTGERDAHDVFAMHDDGTILKPVFAYRPAEYLDPIASLNRAVTRIINSNFMDDVKVSSIESWLAKWRTMLNPEDQALSYKNPWSAFVNAPLKSGLPSNVARQIEAERLQIKMFSRIPTSWDTTLTAVSQFLEDSIYKANGPATRVPLVMTKWGFDTAMEVPQFMRAVTYRADIGFFSIPQLLVQSNTYVTMAGIAGFKKAGQGTAAAMLHQYSRLPNVTPDILKALDKKAVALGWKPGEWLEAREILTKKTGFEFVGRETNMTMDEPYGYKMIQSRWGSFLNAGEMFFKGGERNARYGAWYTAFKEFRDLNPTGRLTTNDINSILLRADDLAGNMTRASKSALQMGPMAFPSQFIGYSLRIMEQFTGKRLTWQQKARLFGVYGAVYGLPFTTGLVSVFPFTDQIRQYAMEHGYIEGENGIADTAFNGIPAYLGQLITGQTYNVGSRYGNLEIGNFLNSDKTWWEALGGATVNTVENMWSSSQPFIRMGVGFVKGEDVMVHPSSADWIAPLKTLAAVNSAWRLDMAVAYGNWYSRNEGLLGKDVKLTEATLLTITGLSRIEWDKIQLRTHQAQDWETKWKYAEQFFIRDYRRMLRDIANKDPVSAATHWNNANVYTEAMQYPIQRRHDLYARANQSQTIPDLELWNATFGKNVPAGLEKYRQELFGREQAAKAQ